MDDPHHWKVLRFTEPYDGQLQGSVVFRVAQRCLSIQYVSAISQAQAADQLTKRVVSL